MCCLAFSGFSTLPFGGGGNMWRESATHITDVRKGLVIQSKSC